MGAELITVWCAVLCAAAAVRLLHRQDEAVRRARLMFAGAGPPARTGGSGRSCRGAVEKAARVALARARRRLERRLGLRIGYEVLCLPAGVLLCFPAHSPVPALAGLVAMPCLRRQLSVRAARSAAEARRKAVAGLCAALAGELRAGRPPETALAEAVERLRAGRTGGPVDRGLTAVLAAARFGGDVPQALGRAARRPGAEGLASAAACWEVAVDGGAGLAAGLDRVAAALRAEHDRREDLRAQLAGPRSTAVMLALLPVFGVLLGMTLGADPLRVLFRTPAGLGCLLVGVALEWAGLAWTGRIMRAAEVAA